jgi:hypothetical protein
MDRREGQLIGVWHRIAEVWLEFALFAVMHCWRPVRGISRGE